MTGEQFLNSIRCLDLEITAMDHERDKIEYRRLDLLEKAECMGASLTGVHVQHGVNSKTESLGVQLADTMSCEDVVRKLNDYQNQINQRIDELVARKKCAEDTIKRIPDARYRTLLVHRYISNLKWPTIADLMGYAEGYVRGIMKDQAIMAFDQAGET